MFGRFAPPLLRLKRALNRGWSLEEPVLLGAEASPLPYEGGTYHFVLRSEADNRTETISLPPSSELLLFLSELNVSIALKQ